MKKLIVLFSVALVVITGCRETQQQEENAAQVIMHMQHFEDGTETPINGEREYFKDGNLHQKVFFVDGYPQTVSTHFPTGQKKVKMVVAEGGKGKIYHTEWYESGQKKFEGTSESIKEWHENGQLKSESHYDENGNLHGIAKMWDEEGALQGQEKYEHGELVESS